MSTYPHDHGGHPLIDPNLPYAPPPPGELYQPPPASGAPGIPVELAPATPTPLTTTVSGASVPIQVPPPGLGMPLDEVLAASRVERARVTVLREGIPVDVLPVIEGRVTVEAERTPRRTLDVNVVGDPWWVPTKPYHALDPRASATELRAEVGVVDPITGGEYWWSLGVFVVRTAKVTHRAGEVVIEASCPDRSAARRWPLEGGVALASGITVEEAIATLLTVGRGEIDLPLTPTGHNLPATILGNLGDDPWAVASELAAQVGFDLGYDVLGIPRLTPIIDPATVAPAHTWSTEHLDSPLTDLSRDLDGGEMVDGIIVRWSGGTVIYPSILANYPVVWDGDSSLILDEAMARSVASTELLKREGMIETLQLTTWTDPRCEVGEVVRVIDGASGIDFSARITGLGYGLLRPTMEVRLANRRVTT